MGWCCAPSPVRATSRWNDSDGAAAVVERALAPADALVPRPEPERPHADEALPFFLAYYREHKLDRTTVYPGVLASLTAMRERHPHLPMAVLTNKPAGPSRAICTHFGFDRFCFRVYGGDSFPTKKPQPAGLLALFQEPSALLGSPLRADEAVMIGDSHVDIETARAAGTRSLGCLFGLAPDSLRAARPDALVESAAEWPTALGL